MNNSLMNDALAILTNGNHRADDDAVIHKCCLAVTKRDYCAVTRRDFEQALDLLAAGYRNQQSNLGKHISHAAAYVEILKTKAGSSLYTGLDNLIRYGGAPPVEP